MQLTGIDQQFIVHLLYITVVLILLQVWIQVPMENPIKQAYSYREEDCGKVESPWEWWNAFRIVCDYNRKLGVALIVSHDLPDQEEVFKKLLFSVHLINKMKTQM